MISVDNLYWVLYHHLLRPAGLDCCYYYPFGTTQNLSHQGEFKPRRIRHEHHVLFHFDQEPLYSDDLGQLYQSHQQYFSTKICKILANSEHSLTKRLVCDNRSMLDWYFFYHGLISQDWFRDTRYLADLYSPISVFCSLNHVVTGKRSYRMALTARLMDQDLEEFGQISFHGDQQVCQQEIDFADSELSGYDKKLIRTNIIDSRRTWPMILDSTNVDGSFSARLGHVEYRLWQQSLFHIVNETVFYDAKLHLTEKIFKPIVALRPFVLVAAPGNLAYLQSYGFRTFDAWIDESYDTILAPDSRLQAITQVIKGLCDLTTRQLQAMHQDMMSVLIYNKNHFFTEFKDMIVDELVDNFDGCIKIWNNGRLETERMVQELYDTRLVKRILKQ